MINHQLIDPKSIVVVGASNNTSKPGGKLFYNIRTGSFKGRLYAMNPKEDEIQGLPSYKTLEELPATDMAILAVPAKLCAAIVRELAEKKGTRAFIIVSAGFGEENEEGAGIEQEIVTICKEYDASLIGPNCIGVMTPAYQGVFTLPIPKLDPSGCDFISGSGATAVFIMEAGLQKGLRFNHVFSVGNSAQLGVEDVLKYLDETYEEGRSSKVKMLYFENIKNPALLLKHASSLISKGCKIAAIKAGTTDAGSRAASSHTGAMASSDTAVDALFRKAGIVRCYGREDLTTVASVMLYPELKGKRVAIITHAGGPAVMLTDRLSQGGLEVPHLQGPAAEELLEKLFPGSSVANPIDILATGTAEQVGECLDYCEKRFTEIDAMVVIFGTPGLDPVFDVYDVIYEKMQSSTKPIYPVLPSLTTAAEEVKHFLGKGKVNFPDEVLLGDALARLKNTAAPMNAGELPADTKPEKVQEVLDRSDEGYLEPEAVQEVLDAAGVPRVREHVADNREELLEEVNLCGYPLVMKVVGPVHKSDVGGVQLDIQSKEEVLEHFERMMKIPDATGILVQPMLSGTELFIGAKYEPDYGHIVLCGLGGIYVEVLKDTAAGLAPLGKEEALSMIRSLRGYKMLEGVRGQEGVNIEAYADILVRLSHALAFTRGIAEMDLNPLMGRGTEVVAVDARIRKANEL